ncbi:OX-2 membrane glyco -like isoform X2 [Pelobates cultripes]|uniref:OX-2 membrane glyco -like isoform X2 n=1 Tax=Pelobates cultripes TaxID=61616 RepID=A0AAD1QYR9_PELCU|nr:OX-2 membrane glyco -like isoform X2 [Pelobates cultripes]
MDWKVKEEYLLILCVFASVCMISNAHVDVLTENPKPVKVGEKVTLTCTLQKKDYKARLVTWKRTIKDKDVTLGTFSAVNREMIVNQYKDILSITTPGLYSTAITIWKATLGDEGNYKCIFSVVGIPSLEKNIFLYVYEPVKGSLTKYNETSNSFTVTCVTSSWPVAEVSWFGVGTNNKNGTHMETTNGTATLTKWIVLDAKSKSELTEKLECRVHHMGNNTIFKLPHVLAENPKPVKVGEKVTLTCTLQASDYKARLVTWKRTIKDKDVTLGTFSAVNREMIVNQYKDILNITTPGLYSTAITIWKATTSDEGNYKCIFSVVGIPSLEKHIVVSVYEPVKGSLTKYNETTESFMAMCVTSSWPVAEVSWFGVGMNNKNGTHVETINGTATLTNWIVLDTKNKGKLECRVHHMGNSNTFKLPLPSRSIRLHPCFCFEIFLGLLIYF